MPGSWYASVTNSSLEQGDLIAALPIVRAELTAADIEALTSPQGAADPDMANAAEIVTIDAVVMTQSCDLENDKVDSVLLCPYWTEHEFPGNRDKKEQIRKGNAHGWHLLNSDEDLNLPRLFVEFSRIYTAPKGAVIAFANTLSNRPRLVSPYREHLSQAFARFFMRVGLPSGVAPFK